MALWMGNRNVTYFTAIDNVPNLRLSSVAESCAKSPNPCFETGEFMNTTDIWQFITTHGVEFGIKLATAIVA